MYNRCKIQAYLKVIFYALSNEAIIIDVANFIG